MVDLKVLTDAVGALDEEKVMSLLRDFLATNPTAGDAQQVVNACQQGMAIVGDLFEQGEYFVGDLIFAGELLTNAIEILKPVIGQESSEKIGKIVLGTVHGDLHDIGKNIFRSMAEAAGFEVHDIGIDQPPSAFVDKVKEVNPDIVGMSGVLTLALESMKNWWRERSRHRDRVKSLSVETPYQRSLANRADALPPTLPRSENLPEVGEKL